MPTTFFSGGEIARFEGMQLKSSDYLRDPAEVLLAINVHGDRVGSLMKRPGYTIIGSTIGASQNILGLQPYYQAGAARRLLTLVNGVANASIYFSTGGAWTVIDAARDANALYEGEQFLNRVYFVGQDPDTNTFASNFFISGVAITTAHSSLTDMPQARWIRRFKDLLYVGNVRSGGANYPSRVYYSNTPSGGNITWSTTRFITVPEDNNEAITGLEVNADRLLIFKERSLYRWDESEIRYVADTGTTTGRSIRTIGYQTFFYSQNGAGIYVYSGGKPQLISQKIQPIIDGITQTTVDEVRAESDYDHYYLFVGTITVDLPAGDNISVSNAVIVYTVSTNSWYLYSFSDAVRSMARFVDDTNGFDRFYFGNNNGEIFRLAYDTDDVFSDDGDAISALVRYRTPIGSPHQTKFVHKVWPLVDRAQGMSFRLRADDKDWRGQTQINRNAQPIPVDNIEGKVFDFEVSESSILAPFILNSFAFAVTQRTNEL